MAPFRDLLKKNRKFYWDNNLQKLFDDAKEIIVKNVTDSIMRFQKDRHTALMTDWSKNRVGYMLLQKYCSCSDINPRCCS